MRPTRSALFVPGNREDWLRDAHRHGADVIILDLEDSVPTKEKDNARETVANGIARIADRGQRVFVRVNGHPNDDSQRFTEDIEAIVDEAIDGLVVPMVRTVEDVAALDAVLGHVERRKGLNENQLSLVVTIETAPAMRAVYDLCQVPERPITIECGAVKGTDTNRALGFDWTGPGREGLETLHMREKALLDARAAGVENPLAGTYVDVDDIAGLREDMQFSRQIGYRGYVVIHPSHVPHANEIFMPDETTVEYWLGAIRALRKAAAEGKSSVRYEGDMIDTANLATANRVLSLARHFESDLNIDVDDWPTEEAD